MRARCHNPDAPNYYMYGARGIAVCELWRDSFWAFVADMGPRPQGTTLERIDNALGYSKANCRWATPREQASNRRNNVSITLDGVKLSVDQWAERLGLCPGLIRNRIRAGLPPERVLSHADLRKQRVRK
jgi:hypothetical protein